MRMNAYYYGFAPTGVCTIDRILSAVACAGKSYHHIREWRDEADPCTHHVGKSPVDWIQNAANDAAKLFAIAPQPLTVAEQPVDEDNERDLFEFAFPCLNFLREDIRGKSGDYWNVQTREYFNVWKARAALAKGGE